MSLGINLVKLSAVFLTAGLMVAGNALGASESSGNEKEKSANDKDKVILSDPGKKQTKADVQELINEFTAIKGKLKDIQQTALENNPELKEQKEELDRLIKKTFDENLAAEGVEMARIRDIEKELKTDKDMGPEKKERLEKEYKEAKQAYRKVQAKTMQNEKVQEGRRDFREKIVVAMKEENPKVQDMIERLQILQQKINQARRQSGPAPKKSPE